MKYTKCKSCEERILEKAESCPSCGTRQKVNLNSLAAVFIIIGTLIIAVRLFGLDFSIFTKNPTVIGSLMNDDTSSKRQTSSPDQQPSATVQPPAGSARTPLEGDVTIIVEVTELPDGRVHLHGTTNLPTDTNLMLSVEERAESGFMGQSKCAVASDGAFNSEAFGPASGLKDGVYVAGVVMPIPRVQPESVKQIIGSDGENLSGPLVENGTFGVTVSAEKEFTIGGEQAAQAQQQRVKERIQQYHEWEKKVTALHSNLQAARGSRDPAKWSQFARQFRSDIQLHQDQLMQVQPVSVRFVVGDPLDAVRRMFHARAFQKPEDYNEASADYTKCLKELQRFIRESEAKQ